MCMLMYVYVHIYVSYIICMYTHIHIINSNKKKFVHIFSNYMYVQNQSLIKNVL